MVIYVLAAIVLIISIAMFIISFRSFREKGFLLNNAYIFESEENRKTMNKKPHYRQTAVVFLMLGIVFLIIATELILKTGWLFYVDILCMVIVLVYAIVSSIEISKRN